ncbi:Gingipain domain-containing protein [Candidatus Magnetomoraceae bacterium gMMP-15]
MNKNIIKTNSYIAIIALFLCLLSSMVFANDIKVISEDDYGLTLELTLPCFNFEKLNLSDGNYLRIHVDEWTVTSETGGPELPLQGLLLQVPKIGKIEIQPLENKYETLNDCLIYPVPRLIMSDNGESFTEFIKDSVIYNNSNFFPGILAEFDKRAVLRNTTVSRLKFYPFQWNPVTKELRYYKKMRFKISFENPLSLIKERKSLSFLNEPYEKLKNELIANYHKGLESKSRKSEFKEARTTSQNFQLKIKIKEDGIYRIRHEELVTAGLDIDSIDPASFQIFNYGQEIAIKIVSSGSKFQQVDYIEFFGKKIDNQFTGTNVYWLAWGLSSGKHIESIDGTVTGQSAAQNFFNEQLHIEENHTLWEKTPGAPDQDYAFWQKITSPISIDYSLDIPSPVLDQDNILIKVCFQGLSISSTNPNNHHTQLLLNNNLIGNADWGNRIEYIQEAVISSELLNDSENKLTISMPAVKLDSVFINWIEIVYKRYFEAVDDTLVFTIEENDRVKIEISKLSQSNVIIYDITDPFNVKQVENILIQPDGENYKVTFEDYIPDKKTYYILTESKIKQPDYIGLRELTKLKNPENQADYIIISPEEFFDSLKPLIEVRESEGLNTLSVDIEDIYNEFNYGIFDPKAIKDFLQYAYENWSEPAPTYVLLTGDANMDYRNYFDKNKENKVPTHLSITSEFGLTPDDNWYVCVQGDDILPDMFIGRIPGNSSEMVEKIVNKIIRYRGSKNYANESVLMVADDMASEYQTINNELISDLPESVTVDKVYLSSYTNDENATNDIISSINQGKFIINYVGHGSITNWAGELILESPDIALLQNENKLSFVILMTCLNGFFAHWETYCIAEEFLIAPNKGAVAVFAPSSLGSAWDHRLLDKAIFSNIFEKKKEIVGAIVTYSKIEAYSHIISDDIIRMFHFIGDPATSLKRKINTINLEHAIIILKIISGLPVSSVNTINADINTDGIVDLIDVIYVLKYLK